MPPDQRPPSTGRVTGWRPGSGPSLEDAAELLATRELTIEGRLPWSSNLTFLVTLEGTGDDEPGDGAGGHLDDGHHPSRPVQAVYKPHQGEQSLWDFPDGLYRREVAAYQLSEALGWGIVPPTVLREDGPFGPGSVQLFVEADYEEHYFTLLEEGGHDGQLQVFCAFDVVANNADRKSGHVLHTGEGRLWGIDHGLCFHVQHKLRTVIWDFADDEVPRWIVDDLERLASTGLPDDVASLLSRAEAEAVLERAARAGGRRGLPRAGGRPPPLPLATGLSRRPPVRVGLHPPAAPDDDRRALGPEGVAQVRRTGPPTAGHEEDVEVGLHGRGDARRPDGRHLRGSGGCRRGPHVDLGTRRVGEVGGEAAVGVAQRRVPTTGRRRVRRSRPPGPAPAS